MSNNLLKELSDRLAAKVFELGSPKWCALSGEIYRQVEAYEAAKAPEPDNSMSARIAWSEKHGSPGLIDIEAFLIELGRPHLKTAFRGDGNPSDDEVAREIGISLIQVHLGLAEPINLDDGLEGKATHGQPVGKSMREQAEENVLSIRGSYDAPGFDACVDAEELRMKREAQQPDEKPVPLAKARPWPGVSNVDLMQIATKAFCRHNPAGYNWSGQALEAACKAYHKAAIPEQPVDTSDIAHKLEYAFPQISLSALSDIIEYFRPYLRPPEREAVEQEPKDFNLESALDFLRAHNDGVYRIYASSKCDALVEWLLDYLQPYRIRGEHKKVIEAAINEWLDSMGVNIGGKYNDEKTSRDFLARNIVIALSKIEEQPRRGTDNG